MAVGDPCTDNASQRQSMDMLWYAHKYGLVRDDDYEFLTTACEYSDPRPLAAGAWHVPLRGDGLVRVLSSLSAPNKNRSKECIAAHRRYMLSSSRGLSQDWQLAYINELSLYSPSGPERFDIPGSWNYKTATFMNNPLTRKALHVSNAPVKAWPGPPPGWVYKSSYGACNDAAPPNVKSMVDFYRTLAPLLPGRIAVYNGDTDPCVSYEGTRIAIQKVRLGPVTSLVLCECALWLVLAPNMKISQHVTCSCKLICGRSGLLRFSRRARGSLISLQQLRRPSPAKMCCSEACSPRWEPVLNLEVKSLITSTPSPLSLYTDRDTWSQPSAHVPPCSSFGTWWRTRASRRLS